MKVQTWKQEIVPTITEDYKYNFSKCFGKYSSITLVADEHFLLTNKEEINNLMMNMRRPFPKILTILFRGIKEVIPKIDFYTSSRHT